VVPGGEIAELAAGDELEAAAQALVQRANQYGGPDNVTVVLIEP
jgi:serine/threonine protein phosphatase PrpC